MYKIEPQLWSRAEVDCIHLQTWDLEHIIVPLNQVTRLKRCLVCFQWFLSNERKRDYKVKKHPVYREDFTHWGMRGMTSSGHRGCRITKKRKNNKTHKKLKKQGTIKFKNWQKGEKHVESSTDFFRRSILKNVQNLFSPLVVMRVDGLLVFFYYWSKNWC